MRRGHSTTAVDTSGFDDTIAQLTEQFTAGDITGAQLGVLADGLRRQHDAEAVPALSLPNVDDTKKAWPKLNLEQRQLIVKAATEALLIQPWTPSNTFDDTRIVWTPVR